MMKRLLPFFLLAASASAQTLKVYPTAPISTAGIDQSVTAYVTGVNNKTVTWTTSGGSLVGTNPCVVNEPCTIALHTTTPGTYTVTATSNANGAVHAASTVTITASPTKLTTNPKFIVTAAMLSSLQAKTTAGNPMWQSIQTVAINAFNVDNAIWGWSCGGGTGTGNGLPSSPQFDIGGRAYFYAYMQLVNPYPTAQTTYNWGCYGRDEWVYDMNQVMSGAFFIGGNAWSDSAVYTALATDWLMGSGSLSTSDKNLARLFFSWYEQYVLPTQYPAAPPTSPGNSIALVGNSLGEMRLAANNYTMSKMMLTEAAGLTYNDNSTDDPPIPQNGVLAATVTAGGSSCSVGNTINIGSGGSVMQVVDVSGSAATALAPVTLGTGYSLSSQSTTPATGSCTGVTVNVTMLSNTCGAARGAVCSDYSTGSLSGYWTYFDQVLLYIDYANMEDPSVVQQAYNTAYANMPSIPTCQYVNGSNDVCLGGVRDGASGEGSYYQYSMYKLAYAMNMMHTAGYDDATLYGPQISLETSSWWDMKYIGDLAFLTDMNANNGAGSGLGGVTPGFGYLTTGDSNFYFHKILDMYTEAVMMATDSNVGRTDRSSALEWLVLNMAYGGPDGTQDGCTAFCGSVANMVSDATNGFVYTIPLMIALPAANPVTSPPADPRPSLPTDTYNASIAQQVSIRNGWTPNNYTLFSFYCPSGINNHEKANCGRTDIYSNGEFITKGRTEFDDYNDSMSVSTSSNDAAYTNTLNPSGHVCDFTVNCFVSPGTAYGGPYWGGNQQSMAPAILHSELPGYAAQSVNTTGLYNGWFYFSLPFDLASYDDVQTASRDEVYLRGSNQVVFYDRAVTGHSAEKSVSFNTTGTPTIVGNTATWLTQSGNQKAHLTSLLTTGTTFSESHLPLTTTTSTQFANLQVGTTMTSTCISTAVDGSNTNVTTLGLPRVNLASSNPSIASVNQSTGVITGVALGTVSIYCEYYPGVNTNSMISGVTINVVSGTSSGTATNTSAPTPQLTDWELKSQIRTDIAAATSSNFEHVLCWDATASPTCPTPTLVQSNAGQAFDGTVSGNSQVMFMHTVATFTGTTVPVPGAETLYVQDLTPNTSYPASGAGVASSVTTDDAGVAVLSPTGAGNVVLGSGAPPPAAPTQLQGVILRGGSVQ